MSKLEMSAGLSVVSDQHDALTTPQSSEVDALRADVAALQAVILQLATMTGVCKDALQASFDHECPAMAQPCLHTLAIMGTLTEMVACHKVGQAFDAALAAEWLAPPMLAKRMRAAGYLA